MVHEAKNTCRLASAYAWLLHSNRCSSRNAGRQRALLFLAETLRNGHGFLWGFALEVPTTLQTPRRRSNGSSSLEAHAS